MLYCSIYIRIYTILYYTILYSNYTILYYSILYTILYSNYIYYTILSVTFNTILMAHTFLRERGTMDLRKHAINKTALVHRAHARECPDCGVLNISREPLYLQPEAKVH